jgi:hypothetical protein
VKYSNEGFDFNDTELPEIAADVSCRPSLHYSSNARRIKRFTLK